MRSEISLIRLREESNHVDTEEDEASIPDQFIFFDSKNDTFKRRIIYKVLRTHKMLQMLKCLLEISHILFDSQIRILTFPRHCWK